MPFSNIRQVNYLVSSRAVAKLCLGLARRKRGRGSFVNILLLADTVSERWTAGRMKTSRKYEGILKYERLKLLPSSSSLVVIETFMMEVPYLTQSLRFLPKPGTRHYVNLNLKDLFFFFLFLDNT